MHIACACDLALGITFRVICANVSQIIIFTIITIEMHAGYLINIFTTKNVNSHTAQ